MFVFSRSNTIWNLINPILYFEPLKKYLQFEFLWIYKNFNNECFSGDQIKFLEQTFIIKMHVVIVILFLPVWEMFDYGMCHYGIRHFQVSFLFFFFFKEIFYFLLFILFIFYFLAISRSSEKGNGFALWQPFYHKYC